jgi:hypothetical protein
MSNTTTPECRDKIISVYEKCQVQFTAYNNTVVNTANQDALFKECVLGKSCTPTQKEDLERICPHAKNYLECTGPAMDCLLGGNSTLIQYIDELKKVCDNSTSDADSNNNGTVNIPGEGFSITMPWSLLLVFLV